jgi:hypothetical protein
MLINGQGELEYRTVRSRLRPQLTAVGFNDRATDCQSKSNAMPFCREIGLKNATRTFRIESDARILHSYQHPVGMGLRSDIQLPRSGIYSLHGFDPVHDEVDQDLLQLNPVADDAR